VQIVTYLGLSMGNYRVTCSQGDTALLLLPSDFINTVRHIAQGWWERWKSWISSHATHLDRSQSQQLHKRWAILHKT